MLVNYFNKRKTLTAILHNGKLIRIDFIVQIFYTTTIKIISLAKTKIPKSYHPPIVPYIFYIMTF